MKYTIILLLTLLSTTIAISNLDWSKIKPKTALIEPLSNIKLLPSKERIIGGTEVIPHSIPYQVALIINGVDFCGGSVISDIWVLTAAHCVVGASYIEMIYGAHNVTDSESTQVIVTSNSFITHAKFNSNTYVYDIALVKSPSTISFNENIHTIPLATASSGNYAESTALLAGWGEMSGFIFDLSPVLRQVNLSILTNKECTGYYGNIILSSSLCTDGLDGDVGACVGDDGGALVVDGVQVGVTSYASTRSCTAGLPSVFARISYFRNWILNNSGV